MKAKTKDRIERQRIGLLAKVHIAKKDLGIIDDDYRVILRREFGVGSAAALSNKELEALVKYFESKGWQAQPATTKEGNKKSKTKSRNPESNRVFALKERIEEMVSKMNMPPKRYRGLCRRFLDVDELDWYEGDSQPLKQFLAVLGNIEKKERAA